MNNNRPNKLAILSPAPGQTLLELEEITGVGNPRSRIAVIIDEYAPKTVYSDRSGAWSLINPYALDVGEHTVIARTRAYGRGCMISVGFTIRDNSTYLPLPIILDPADCSMVDDSLVRLIGTGTPGNIIKAAIRSHCRETTDVGANGIWKTVFFGPFASGRYVATATEYDGNGNSSPTAWCEFWVK